MKKLLSPVYVALALGLPAAAAQAGEPVDLQLASSAEIFYRADTAPQHAAVAEPAPVLVAENALDSAVSNKQLAATDAVDAEGMLKVDVVRIATGYRASEVIGKDVRNDGEDSIGKIDDLIVRTDDKVVFAVVSVGGFLGIGDRLIAVPYKSLSFDAEGNVRLAGVTKEDLKAAPEFRYKD